MGPSGVSIAAGTTVSFYLYVDASTNVSSANPFVRTGSQQRGPPQPAVVESAQGLVERGQRRGAVGRDRQPGRRRVPDQRRVHGVRRQRHAARSPPMVTWSASMAERSDSVDAICARATTDSHAALLASDEMNGAHRDTLVAFCFAHATVRFRFARNGQAPCPSPATNSATSPCASPRRGDLDDLLALLRDVRERDAGARARPVGRRLSRSRDAARRHRDAHALPGRARRRSRCWARSR